VPNQESRYAIVLLRHSGSKLDPPVRFLQAPASMVVGNRFLARKLIQRMGRAHDRGETQEFERLREQLERNYLDGAVRYELLFERYEPLTRWKSGESTETRSLGRFDFGRGEA
jgi:hypothetical protein